MLSVRRRGSVEPPQGYRTPHGNTRETLRMPSGDPRATPCHCTHLFHPALKVSNPSHIHIKRCQSRQMVCQPGIPSCLRARKPPNRAVATSTLRLLQPPFGRPNRFSNMASASRSEEHTSELQSPMYLGCRLLLEKKKFEMLQSIVLPRSDAPRNSLPPPCAT